MKNNNHPTGVNHVCLECHRQRSVKKYGITWLEYTRILEQQGDTCGICFGVLPVSVTRRLSVDHCHTTGEVRGILCQRCNSAIGLLGENENVLLNAIAYLKLHNNSLQNFTPNKLT